MKDGKCHHNVRERFDHSTRNACHACTREESSVILAALTRKTRHVEALQETIIDLRQSLADVTTRMDFQAGRVKALIRQNEERTKC